MSPLVNRQPPSALATPAASGSDASRSAEYFSRVKARQGKLHTTLVGLVSETPQIVWEVGCGHGHFLTAYATAHPQQTCIGVDIVRERIARATRKRIRAKLERLHFVVAEAHEFLDALPKEVRLARIFVLFPDPWPKRRHHKNRLMQRDFLDRLVQRVGQGTRLHFRTDYEPYFAQVASTLRSHPNWSLSDEPWPFELETVFQARASGYYSLTAVAKAAP